MVTILLMRHAKAEKPSPGVEDFDRALQPVGKADAQRMGRMLASRFGPPGRVVCSSARRTRQTLEALGLDLGDDQVEFSDKLFDGTKQACIEVLRGQDAAMILLVGHNPGAHDAAMALTSEGESRPWTALVAGFPTASLAVLEFPGALSELREGSCFLKEFLTPEDLPA